MKHFRFSLALVVLAFAAIESSACIDVGPKLVTNFDFEMKSEDVLKITMTNTKGDSFEKVGILDDDGFITSYIILGHLSSKNFEGLDAERQKAALESQLSRLQSKLLSKDYRNFIVGEIGQAKYDDAILALEQLKKDLAKSPKIEKNHHKAFAQATQDIGTLFSYKHKLEGGTAMGQPAEGFRTADLPKAITGLRSRSVGGCGPGDSQLGLVPLKAGGTNAGLVVPGSFSTK